MTNSWTLPQLENVKKIRHLASPSSSTRLNNLPIIIILPTFVQPFMTPSHIFLDLEIPSQKIQYLMKTISLNLIKYLTFIVLNKCTLEKPTTTCPSWLSQHLLAIYRSSYWKISMTPSSSYIPLHGYYEDGEWTIFMSVNPFFFFALLTTNCKLHVYCCQH